MIPTAEKVQRCGYDFCDRDLVREIRTWQKGMPPEFSERFTNGDCIICCNHAYVASEMSYDRCMGNIGKIASKPLHL